MPVVGAVRAGNAVERFVASRFRYFDRPSVGVVAGRPVHIDEILRRDELAVGAVDDEEEAVLRRVQDLLARRAVDIGGGGGRGRGGRGGPGGARRGRGGPD